MSALRNRVARLERTTTPSEDDPIRAILLVSPSEHPAKGYRYGEITVMRQDGESDADLERRVESMSAGTGIRIWAEVA